MSSTATSSTAHLMDAMVTMRSSSDTPRRPASARQTSNRPAHDGPAAATVESARLDAGPKRDLLPRRAGRRTAAGPASATEPGRSGCCHAGRPNRYTACACGGVRGVGDGPAVRSARAAPPPVQVGPADQHHPEDHILLELGPQMLDDVCDGVPGRGERPGRGGRSRTLG